MSAHSVPTLLQARRQRVWAATLLLALFPGFFAYQTLLAFNLIPPIPYGFYSVAGTVTAPILAGLLWRTTGRYRACWTIIDAIFLGLMLLWLTIATLSYATGHVGGGNSEMLLWSISGITLNAISYSLARIIPPSSTAFLGALGFTLICMAATVFLNIGDGGMFYLRQSVDAKDSVATYQAFARAISVVALLLLGGTASRNMRGITALTAAIAIAILFFNGARTELACFVFAATAVAIASTGLTRTFVGILILTPVALILPLFGSSEFYANYVVSNRAFQLVELETSTSAAERIALSESALNTIAAHPLFGDYASYLSLGGIGNYSHNILSAWVNLGFLGFAGYVITICFCVRVILRRPRADAASQWHFVATAFTMFTAAAMAFGKDYSYLFFGFMVGFCSNLIAINRTFHAPSDEQQ